MSRGFYSLQEAIKIIEKKHPNKFYYNKIIYVNRNTQKVYEEYMNTETAEILSRHIDIIKYKTKEPVEVVKVGEEYAINLPSWSYLERDDILSLISQFYDEYEEKGISAAWSVDSSVKADNLSEIDKILFDFNTITVKPFAKVSFEKPNLDFLSISDNHILLESDISNTCVSRKRNFKATISEKKDSYKTEDEYAMAKDVIVSESKRADAAEEKASENEKLSNVARYLIGIGIGIAVLIVLFSLVRLGKIVLKRG